MRLYLSIALVAVLVLLWVNDRRKQYMNGMTDMQKAYAVQIEKSKGLLDVEKKSANDAATRAARRVCVKRGVDPSECDNL